MHGQLSDDTIKALIRWCLDSAADRGPHITRFRMYRVLDGAFAGHDGPDKQALTISSSSEFARDVLGLRQARYTEAEYPEHNLLHLGFPDESFDFCVSDQVLEHVEGDPFAGFKEMTRVLKPGGLHCHTTCFVNHIHDVPDFWRFSREALALLARTAGCEVLSTGGWGNQEAWALINAGFRYESIPQDERNPLYRIAMQNDPAWPIHTWITARKLPAR